MKVSDNAATSSAVRATVKATETAAEPTENDCPLAAASTAVQTPSPRIDFADAAPRMNMEPATDMNME